MWTQTSPFSPEAKRRIDFNKTFLGKNRKELNHEQRRLGDREEKPIFMAAALCTGSWLVLSVAQEVALRCGDRHPSPCSDGPWEFLWQFPSPLAGILVPQTSLGVGEGDFPLTSQTQVYPKVR